VQLLQQKKNPTNLQTFTEILQKIIEITNFKRNITEKEMASSERLKERERKEME
jgi:hypothetical protein